MEAIKVNHLKKAYKEHLAVDDISFSVEEGELFAFLGENGAGKSTTINILCTILEKNAGDIEICGHKLGKEDDAIRDSIGIVFQNSVLDPKLTVRENLLLRGSYYGLSKKTIEHRLDAFNDSFEMTDIWNRKYEKLSGGQRRRVDIMRALINKPRILFLDEPTTGLDPKSRKLVWDYINHLRKYKGMTIFLTTHYMEETKDADHVVILDKGHIVSQGTPSELKTRYASSRLVWYTNESMDAESILKGFEYNYDADHYNIKIKETAFADISEFIYTNRQFITDYEVIKGSMDDVFLNLTGKELQ